MRERDDGQFVLEVICRGCGHRFDLECGPQQPRKYLRSLAATILCPRCAETHEERLERREREAAYATRLTAATLPQHGEWRRLEDFDTRTPDGLDRRPALKAARDWARMADPRGLLLTGAVGCGKTQLARAAADERLRHYPLRWVSWAALVSDLGNFTESKGAGPAKRAGALRVLQGSGALVIDDFDKGGKPTDWLLHQLFVALDRRIVAGAPLLLTTNLGVPELRERFGDAITSRLIGYCRVIEFAGPDYRLLNRPAPLAA